MKSTSQGTVRCRIRSAMKKTAPLRTPTRSRSRPCVDGGDLLAELRDAGAGACPRRSGPRRRRARARSASSSRLLDSTPGSLHDPGHADNLVCRDDERPRRRARGAGSSRRRTRPAPSCRRPRGGRPGRQVRTSSPGRSEAIVQRARSATGPCSSQRGRTRAPHGCRGRGRPPSCRRRSPASSTQRPLERARQARLVSALGEREQVRARPRVERFEERQDLRRGSGRASCRCSSCRAAVREAGGARSTPRVSSRQSVEQRPHDPVLAPGLDPARDGRSRRAGRGRSRPGPRRCGRWRGAGRRRTSSGARAARPRSRPAAPRRPRRRRPHGRSARPRRTPRRAARGSRAGRRRGSRAREHVPEAGRVGSAGDEARHLAAGLDQVVAPDVPLDLPTDIPSSMRSL